MDMYQFKEWFSDAFFPSGQEPTSAFGVQPATPIFNVPIMQDLEVP